MSRILTLTLTIFAVLLLATNLIVTGSGEQEQNQRPITPAEHEAMMMKAMSANIQSVARILKDEKVDLKGELLFTSRGRKKLSAELGEKFPAMQSAKLYSDPLHGVVMADTLTFVEKVLIDADTVVIARQIIFNGSAPVIKGAHELHVFALSSVSAANGTDTVITIDTSGEGVNYVPVPAESSIKADNGSVSINTNGADGEAGLNATAAPSTTATAAASGSTGKPGESGGNGAAGKPGACAADKAGGMGGQGSDGLAGEDGGDGAKGNNGTDAHNQTITIPNTDAPYFQLIGKGGPGSNGGNGGRGGDGGRGGNGGRGGSGIGCQCIPSGVGEGGAGGNAGTGGPGGIAGKGGDGGNGGKAAHFVIFIPPRNYEMSHLRNFGGSGRGGRGGAPGVGGFGGPPGTPGSGGAGGHFATCNARDGADGSAGRTGPSGRHGVWGNWGAWGEVGSLTITII